MFEANRAPAFLRRFELHLDLIRVTFDRYSDIFSHDDSNISNESLSLGEKHKKCDPVSHIHINHEMSL